MVNKVFRMFRIIPAALFVLAWSGCQFLSDGATGSSPFVVDAPDTSKCAVRGDVSTDTPAFTWSAVREATTYTLYVISSDDESMLVRDTNIAIDEGPYTPKEALPEDTALKWTVRGENEKGAGPISQWIDFRITATGNGYEASGNPPVFRWPEMEGATYWLLAGDDADVGSSNWLVDQRELATTTYTAPAKFPAGRTYYWKVKYKAGPFESWYWSPIMPFTIPGEPTTPSYRQLAEYYAPVIYQDIDTEGNCSHADGGRADYITKMNFDGNWYGLDNWENESVCSLPASVYYSVVESTNRYYITYAIFHPRDYCNEYLIGESLDEHENDMEGLWMSVYKNGSFYGNLEAMVTVAHQHFYQYSNYGVDERENIDGGIIMTNGHPTVFIECHGHGIWGDKNWISGFPGNDGVVYKYTGFAQQPVSVTAHRSYSNACAYDLVHIDELWERRPGGVLYAWNMLYDPGKPRNFLGDAKASCGCKLTPNSPHPAWGWDDADDGNRLQGGEQFTDPAYYFDYTLALEKIPGHASPCCETYVNHPYRNP